MDLYLHNARIICSSYGHRRSSMLVRQGRITAFDDANPGDVPTFDAGNHVVIPGLIDAHMHLLMGGIQLRQLDLSAVRSRAAFEDAIRARHDTMPESEWLIANGWNETNWPDSDGMPDASWLAAAGDRPVVCYRSDIHAAVVNDAVLARCPSLDDPPGGRFDCNDDGTCTGLVLESALWKVINPIIPEPSLDEKCAALREAVAHCHALGLTAVGAMEYSRDVESVFRACAQDLTLRAHITFLDERSWPMSFEHFTSFEPFGRVRAIGCKAFIDGTLGSRTAHLLEDYADDPGNKGLAVELGVGSDLATWAHAVVEHGGSPSIHAIGDAAARQVLDAYEHLPRTGPTAVRFEHAQQIASDDIVRTRDMILSMQPLHRTDDARIAEARLGIDRLPGSFAFRALADAGAVLAFGSDWPVVTCDPMAGMRAAITGLVDDGSVFQPDSNLDAAATLQAYTEHAASTLQLSDCGRLELGALADFVVIDEDPLQRDWTDASLPTVLRTYVEGECVYERP